MLFHANVPCTQTEHAKALSRASRAFRGTGDTAAAPTEEKRKAAVELLGRTFLEVAAHVTPTLGKFSLLLDPRRMRFQEGTCGYDKSARDAQSALLAELLRGLVEGGKSASEKLKKDLGGAFLSLERLVAEAEQLGGWTPKGVDALCALVRQLTAREPSGAPFCFMADRVRQVQAAGRVSADLVEDQLSSILGCFRGSRLLQPVPPAVCGVLYSFLGQVRSLLGSGAARGRGVGCVCFMTKM